MDFDSDLLWDIWYHFIVYGTIVIFGLSSIRKISLYTSLKSKLGKDYKSIPNLSVMKKWRKYLFYLMIILSVLMLLFTLIRSESFIYLLPIVLVTDIVYLNGKLKSSYWDILNTFFYSAKGFGAYPGKNKLYSFSVYKWSNVEKVKIRQSGTIIEIKSMFKEKKSMFKEKKSMFIIRCKKYDAEKIKSIFVEKGIVVE